VADEAISSASESELGGETAATGDNSNAVKAKVRYGQDHTTIGLLVASILLLEVSVD
jgi:hypothetical protein